MRLQLKCIRTDFKSRGFLKTCNNYSIFIRSCLVYGELIMCLKWCQVLCRHYLISLCGIQTQINLQTKKLRLNDLSKAIQLLSVKARNQPGLFSSPKPPRLYFYIYTASITHQLTYYKQWKIPFHGWMNSKSKSQEDLDRISYFQVIFFFISLSFDIGLSFDENLKQSSQLKGKPEQLEASRNGQFKGQTSHEPYHSICSLRRIS